MANTYLVTIALGLVFLVFRKIVDYQRSPLKKYPGPFLAGFTYWYRAYWDIWRDGAFLDHIGDLHKQYGPIIRISPNELHFSNPEAFNEIHSLGNKVVKDYDFYRCFNMDTSSFATTDTHHSKVLRSILLPLFSQRTMLPLEGMVQGKADLLAEKVVEAGKNNAIINMGMAIRSTTMDIVTAYLFGSGVGALEAHHFEHPLLVGLERFVPMTWTLRHFPFLLWVSNHLPQKMVNSNEGMASIQAFRDNCGAVLDKTLANPDDLDISEHKTVYTYLLNPIPEKGYNEPLDREGLVNEAVNLVAAGSDTVGTTLHTGVFYVLDNPAIQKRLLEELTEIWPDVDGPSPGHARLSKLPYLTAVIKETLRSSLATPTPIPRVVKADGVVISGETIPVGTVVSSGISFVHRNDKIFPDPMKFDPERWLGANSQSLEHYLTSFSRGNRNCLGQHLAWFDLYIVMATIFRKLDMQLAGTTVEDLHYKQYAVPVFAKPLVVTAKARTA